MPRLLVLGLLAGVAAAPTDDPKTLKLVATIPLAGKAGRLDHLVFDSKGKRLSVSSGAARTLLLPGHMHPGEAVKSPL